MKDIDKSVLFDISNVISSSNPIDIELLVALAKSEHSSPEILGHISKRNEKIVLANLLTNKNITMPVLEEVRKKLVQ